MTKEKLKELQRLCIAKTEKNIERMGSELKGYRACEDGQFFRDLNASSGLQQSLSIGHIFVWIPSFFSGMGVMSYELTKNQKYLKWLYQFYKEYYNKVFETPLETMHDLGFIYSPYAVALYRLTGDTNMKKIGVKAAEELAKRFSPKGNYIRAWGRVDDVVPDYIDDELAQDHFFTKSKGLAIVDCMMNLPLLFWASGVTANPYFKRIACAHADMTLKYFIREDDSVAHAFRFDESTGEPLGITNFCGYSDDSFWSRGATWAMYGFVIAYKYTGDKRYLDASIRVSKAYIKELEEHMVPKGDFRIPQDEENLYDASAAAISACAFIELANYDKETQWLDYADKILETLSTEVFINNDIECPGIIKQTCGRNVYWICADYFFMEAIGKRLGNSVDGW